MNSHHFYKSMYLDIFSVGKGKTVSILLNIHGLTNMYGSNFYSFLQMSSGLNYVLWDQLGFCFLFGGREKNYSNPCFWLCRAPISWTEQLGQGFKIMSQQWLMYGLEHSASMILFTEKYLFSFTVISTNLHIGQFWEEGRKENIFYFCLRKGLKIAKEPQLKNKLQSLNNLYSFLCCSKHIH